MRRLYLVICSVNNVKETRSTWLRCWYTDIVQEICVICYGSSCFTCAETWCCELWGALRIKEESKSVYFIGEKRNVGITEILPRVGHFWTVCEMERKNRCSPEKYYIVVKIWCLLCLCCIRSCNDLGLFLLFPNRFFLGNCWPRLGHWMLTFCHLQDLFGWFIGNCSKWFNLTIVNKCFCAQGGPWY